VTTREAKIRMQGGWRAFPGSKGAIVALAGIDLEVMPLEFLVILGPSGCGKTTLLRILGGLERLGDGRLDIVRQDQSRPLTSMVFQEQSIFPWMTVRGNVEYGLRMRGIPRRQRDPVVCHYLEKVGLVEFADSYPYQLSGGMKQRVSVARAFANDPEILLMDEPFAALDEQNKILLQEELLRIWEEDRKTVVYITHSIDEALVLGDRLIVMTARPGRVKAILEVPFTRPRSVYDIKADPRFGEMARRIWGLLREEVLLSRPQEPAGGQP
jgi:NitT/TauT family transport system ATP-binding protein